MKRLSIFSAAGPLGSSEFCPLSLPHAARRTATPTRRPIRRRRLPICGSVIPLPRADRSRERKRPIRPPTRAGRLYPRPIRDRQLWVWTTNALTQNPRRSREWARRCQCGSTRTVVSRYTRAPRRASSSLRAAVPASWMHRAAPADHDALLRVPLDPHDHPEAQHRIRVVGVRLRLVVVERLGGHRDRVRELVARDASSFSRTSSATSAVSGWSVTTPSG